MDADEMWRGVKLGTMHPADIKDYWDSRAALGETAGTQDLILKQLEQRAILQAMEEPYKFIAQPRILEIGCGIGETARLVAAAYPCARIMAIDRSPAMIDAAMHTQGAGVDFFVGDALHPPDGRFDIIYTQRCLINLETWGHQKTAIERIGSRLVTGGKFIMCEHSQAGLDAINAARGGLGLSSIERPWHNIYMNADLYSIDGLELVECRPFSATYYFLSRVINAKLAAELGQEPAYDAPINKLALTLPSECVDARFAQGKLWVWSKE